MMKDAPSEGSDAPEVPARRNRMLPERPLKLSGQELEARFTSWTGTTRLKVIGDTPEKKVSFLRRLTAGFLLLGIGVCAVALTAEGNAHDAALTASVSRAAELKTQIKSVELPVDANAQVSSLTELGRIAYEEAAAVAAKQQVFAHLYRQAHDEPDSLNGAPGAADEAIARHRQTLEPYFAPSLLKVKNEVAYTFSTANDVEPNEIDPRYEWFIAYKDRAPMDPLAYTWSVESALPGTEVRKGVNVIWAARGSDGRVLAWANGHFSGQDGIFETFEVTITAEGQALLPEGVLEKKSTVPDLLALDREVAR